MPIFNKNFRIFGHFTQEAHRSSICPGGGWQEGGKGYNRDTHRGTMAKALTKFYIGDICWVISNEEYEEFVLPAIAKAFIGKGVLLRKTSDGFSEKSIEFLTGDAGGAGWPQDSGVLGVLRFDDLEPEYQAKSQRLFEGGYVAFFESEAESVFDLRYEELKEQEFFEPEITAEDLEEKAKYWGM